MVGDHPQGVVFKVPHPEDVGRGLDQRLEQVNFVVAVHALHHRGDALQPHAGIYRGAGQRVQFAGGVAVELHEHQVPDLDVAIQVVAFTAGGAAGHVRTVVVEQLGTGAAGAGIAHLPEVVLVQAREALGADPDFLEPDIGGLVIGNVHRHPQPLRRQPHDVGEKGPGELDRLALEIIAKAEVAQHLEKRVVAGGVTHVFQVVVLAAGAHAALAAGRPHIGPRVGAQEGILELVHPRVGEQQGRVIGGHQRAAGHPGMALLFKKGEEGLAYFHGLHRLSRLWNGAGPSRPYVLRRRLFPR